MSNYVFTYQVVYNETAISTMEMHNLEITTRKLKTFNTFDMAFRYVECLNHYTLDDVRWSKIKLFRVVNEPGKRARRYEIEL